MKKISIFLSLILACVFSTNAELNEVRGVLTQSVKYTDNSKNLVGYQFVNENDYSVWVEAELICRGYNYGWNKYRDCYDNRIEGVVDTKSFNLKPKQAYLWKCGERMEMPHAATGNYVDGNCRDDLFFVKYKAYKQE